MSRTVTPARWLRAGVLAATSVGLATGGHLLGGGHAEPVFAGLLFGAVAVAARTWLHRERGLWAIVGAVLVVQVAVHLGLTVGHAHSLSTAMVLTHAGAAILLAVFLRFGEARVHAVARRRLLWLLVAMRLLAGRRPGPLATSSPFIEADGPRSSLWNAAPDHRRGPPIAA